MKKRHTLQHHNTFRYYSAMFLTTAALTLGGCAAQTPPVESYTASGQEQDSQSAEEALPKLPADPAGHQAAFDDFTDRIFCESLQEDLLSLHFTLEDPKAFGIELSEMSFPTLSVEELQQNAKENEQLQKELYSYNTKLLTPEQLFTYKMLQDYLDTEQYARGLELYYQPLSPLIGVQAQLPVLLAEYEFRKRSDIDAYLELLSKIDVYYKQLGDYEKERADAGLAPSDATLDRIIQSCKDYLIRPENSFLTETFAFRLDEIKDLTEEEKSEYKEKHLTILKEHFIPAYTELTETLESLKGRGTNEGGLSGYENGKAYYTYLAAAETGTDSKLEDLKERILKQTSNDMTELSLIVQNEPRLIHQINDSGIRLTEPQTILNHLQFQIAEDFPELTDTGYEIKYIPESLESSLSPAFFLVPPLDSENANTIYINAEASRKQNLYTILAHEGYPGHLYQSVYFNRKNQCPLRRLLTCEGYNEGWGLYSELYSYSFDNGLPEEVQQMLYHSEAAIYGLYALLDIYIHYDGWTLEKTATFLSEFYGIQDPEVVREMYQSIIDNPCNYLKYYAGYLEICTMRDIAKETLGPRFSIKNFHQFILDMDGASFRVIKPYFKTWLLTYDMNTAAE